jgi:HEXXH motif-containing protein
MDAGVTGLVFPGDASAEVERLRRAQVDARAEVLVALWQRGAARDPALARLVPALQAWLTELDPAGWQRSLDLPLLARQLRLPEEGDEALVLKARGALRLMVGAPGFDEALSSQALLPLLGPGPHYLPHPHLVARLVPGGREVVRRGRSVGTMDVLNGVTDIHTRDPSEPWPCDAACQRLAGGLSLLADVWPEAARSMGWWYRNVLLLHDPGGGRYLSFTSQDLPGAYIATASMPAQVCDSLVHEASHARLAVVQAVDPLIVDDGAEIHPSPWRPDPRPLMGLVAGVHAFVNVHAFYARLRALHPHPSLAALAERKLADHRSKLGAVWPHIMAHARPTALGATFLAEMDSYLRSL